VNRAGSAEFPWLSADDWYQFPPPETATAEGIVGVGGNLSPGMLVSAYRQGIFPWFDDRDPIIWWCPDPRFIIQLDELHVSRSLGRVLRRGEFRLTLDHDFGGVIHACAKTPRPGQKGTWITEDMELAYRRLHELGFAHSCEAWQDRELVGGIYGVSIGRMFYGESMFARVSNASKAALVTLARFLRQHGFAVMDAQQRTPHVERMGGREIPRDEFLSIVHQHTERPGIPGTWRDLLRPLKRD
jgi:leucyl/phenylalanyl-tRNA--protein transferase